MNFAPKIRALILKYKLELGTKRNWSVHEKIMKIYVYLYMYCISIFLYM